MKRFEYEITQHLADTFDKIVYFCSKSGQCSIDEVSKYQTKILTNILNNRGKKAGSLSKFLSAKMALWPIGNVELKTRRNSLLERSEESSP